MNPLTDTIIEIGGQDAKFGCSLADYQKLAENVPSPLASDRCTVFMERDISQLLNSGYCVAELLATSLHSVAENYLKKVANEASVGRYVCFQGATAKNRALVAAFEQRLGKKIFVSRYCHLTGALGAAILTSEEMKGAGIFRGLQLYRQNIPISSEICRMCSNNCHISVAEVMGEKVAYGFMCGRDYDTKKYVNKSTSGFNLIEERKKLLISTKPKKYNYGYSIGLPAALHIFEDLYFWKEFFAALGIKTISSENFKEPLREGKRYAGAEFCAPVDSMYGHAAYLAGKADYIFLPVILEARTKNDPHTDRNYCYYTQFSPSLVHTLRIKGLENRLISPQINFTKGKNHVTKKLLASLQVVFGKDLSLHDVETAYQKAIQADRKKKGLLTGLFKKKYKSAGGLSVMLMGRPYVVLPASMNKGIPDIFSGMGVMTFYHDMLPPGVQHEEDVGLLLKKVPWHFAAGILEAAKTVALTENLYPVLITAFKCAPDSFMIEYFKKIFSLHKKPYLILQIDEHDSNIGYETRIEAAIRAFNNHSAKKAVEEKPGTFSLLPRDETKINDKTLLFPNWDSFVSPLLVANLKRSGVDARLLESSELTIKKSMVHNTGQCIPLNIIAQEYMDYIKTHGLNPRKSLLWMMESRLSCNLRMYPFFIKTILEKQGAEFGKASIYSGDLSHKEISLKTTYRGYFAYMAGGLMRKLVCKIRPYEVIPGSTDYEAGRSLELLEEVFLGKRPLEKTIAEITHNFSKMDTFPALKPKVAIFRVMMAAVTSFEDKYYKYFRKILGPQPQINPMKLEAKLSKFNIDIYQSGESYDNLLKVFYIIENHPDVKLFVQISPAYCCPSLITEAMTHEIMRHTGVPVVTITYDGTGNYKNDVITPYLESLKV